MSLPRVLEQQNNHKKKTKKNWSTGSSSKTVQEADLEDSNTEVQNSSVQGADRFRRRCGNHWWKHRRWLSGLRAVSGHKALKQFLQPHSDDRWLKWLLGPLNEGRLLNGPSDPPAEAGSGKAGTETSARDRTEPAGTETSARDKGSCTGHWLCPGSADTVQFLGGRFRGPESAGE